MAFPIFRVAGLLVLGLLFQAHTQAADYYINASGPLGDGSGASAANAADASTPAKYYAINQARTAPGTVIVYAPGTYLMTSAFTMFGGVTHQGAGIDSTTIQVAKGSVSGWSPMWYSRSPTISNFKFYDATIDLNANNQPWWSTRSGSTMAFAFTTADHCTLQRLKFIHMGAKNQESFPVYFLIGGSANGNLNNNLIDSCIFTQPIASGNTNGGVTCIYMGDSEPGITADNTNVVSNCQFLNLKHPEYSDLSYTQCCTSPVAINNKATGVDTLWFIEPGSQTSGNNINFTGQTVQVTGNTLTDSGQVARLLMHPNGAFAGNLNVQNNTVGMTQHPLSAFGLRGPQGVTIEQYWAGNPSVGQITVQNNTFTAPLPMSISPCAVLATLSKGSGKYFYMASLEVLNNTFINFPQDGKELQVTTDPTYNPNYTHTQNTFGTGNQPPSLIPEQKPGTGN
jgi:hypothetical protein